MKSKASLVAIGLCLTIAPSVASAQAQPTWLEDRRYTQGLGYRVGDFELHPGLAGEFGYDTNFLRRAEEENPEDSLRLRITPSFSLESIGRQRRDQEAGGQNAPRPSYELRWGISATYNEFFPVGDGQGDLIRDQRNVAGNTDFNLVILPQRPWSFVLRADAGRDITPSNVGISSASFNRIQAGAGGELVWTPGAGLFDWRAGYGIRGTLFEAEQFDALTNIQHEISTRGRWRFLPRTALLYDGRIGFINYPDETAKTDSMPVRARIGVNGLITSSFSLLAMAGWGASFYEEPEPRDFDSIIGQVEAKFFLTPNPSSEPTLATLAISSVAVGFLRDFYDAYIGTYTERNRAYVGLNYFYGGKFYALLQGGASILGYPRIPELTLTESFTDVLVDATLFGEYRFADAFGVNATLRYDQYFSDAVITDGQGGRDPLEYREFQAYLGVRWVM